MKKYILILLLFITNSTFSQTWFTNLDSAKANAACEKKPLFLLLTGSDWCQSCKCIDDNIFNTEKFKTYATENLILCKIDFPRNIILPDSVLAYRKKIYKDYHGKGFPSMLLINKNDLTVGRLNNWCDYPDEFYNELDELLFKFKKNYNK